MDENKIRELENKIADLEERLSKLENKKQEFVYYNPLKNQQLKQTKAKIPQQTNQKSDKTIDKQQTTNIKKTSKNIEMKMVSVWLTWIGIIAGILAIGFLFQYAIEHKWLTPAARCMCGALASIGFLFSSYILRKKDYQIIADSVFSLSIGIILFTVFAAFSLYEFLDQTESFIYLLIATLIAFSFSVYYKRYIIAVSSLVSALLTPIMLSSGSNSYIFLFSYLCIVYSIYALASLKNKWYSLKLIAIIGISIIFILWYNEHFKYTHLYWVIGFQTILLILVTVSMLIEKGKLKIKHLIPQCIFYVYAIYFITFYTTGEVYVRFNVNLQDVVGLVGIIGCISPFLLLIKYSKDLSSNRSLIIIFLGLVVSTLFIAILEFDDRQILILWMILATSLFLFGRKEPFKSAQVMAIVVIFFSITRLVDDLNEIDKFDWVILNYRMITHLFVILALVVGFYVISWKNKTIFKLILSISFLVYVMILLYFESALFFWNDFSMTLTLTSILWGIMSLILLGIGFVKYRKSFRFAGLGILIITLLKVYIIDIWYFDQAARIIAFIGLAIILLSGAFIYKKFKPYLEREFLKNEK